jgi:hypothetical protein
MVIVVFSCTWPALYSWRTVAGCFKGYTTETALKPPGNPAETLETEKKKPGRLLGKATGPGKDAG